MRKREANKHSPLAVGSEILNLIPQTESAKAGDQPGACRWPRFQSEEVNL
jgi:hypothetical protein